MKKCDVEIFMGSDSDLKSMAKCAEVLDDFGISYNMYILSAHRTTEEALERVATAVERGVRVIIAGAGKAAHLPGVLASKTTLPVIGIPMKTSDLGGVDSLYSMVQMPSGIPVATVAIGDTGAKNAALLAVRILSVSDTELRGKMEDYQKKMRDDVLAKNERLQKEGYKNYLKG
ncbi:MAG TPA: 5-(carboxyamino)imidazole ribonucleotide mutase [Candidatus Mcinerneyibacteriales bacterium]|nr:5-(carboxyamino)imidazole ribonucleotide mutase [Candidatus Mcinerneyibacteriales bacterium]HPJ70172.1 5-(carboxyamino)imidazole ribonucleotide mutase [Candidatus Mcinerneyibacteriales bacterium]HPQ89686.1 5-(carboxyamino)imidazole ribonucleotide mutase [Candidatus Mcinerneyibacteriales bacterium]